MLLRFRREELLNLTIKQLIPEGFHDLLREYVRDLEIQGTLAASQAELRRRDFTTVAVELTGARIPGEEGDPDTYFLLAEDLTEKLKLREKLDQKMDELELEVVARTQELSRERDKVTAFLEQAPDMMLELDALGRVTFANRAACTELGVPLADLVGRPAASFLSSEERTRITGETPRIVEQDGAVLKLDVIGAHGRRIPIEAAATLVRDEQGVATGARLVCRSLVERNEADRRQALLLAAMEGTQDGVIITALDGNIMHVNAAAACTSGSTGHELLGKRLFDLCGTTPEAQSAERRLFGEVLTNGASTGESTRWRDAHTPVPVSVTSALIRDHHRMPMAVVTIQRDLSDERARQKRDQAFRESLVRTEKLSALGELIAGVAHELNNPLGAVLGFAQLIGMGDVSSETQDDVNKLVHAAERCRRIVNNLLTFARKHRPERRPTDLNQVIRDAVALVEYEFNVTNIAIEVTLDPTLPPLSLDGHQVQQVLVNLLKNSEQAIHAARPSGKIAITTSVRNQEVCLCFEDDGPGIPKDLQSKVFDPFFTTKEVGQGTGLGLSITFGIVREHGGNIRVDRGTLPGACFLVTFPAVMPAETMDHEQAQSTGSQSEPERIMGQRILVVDDEEPIRSVVARVMSLSNHHVDVAPNAVAALELLQHHRYDVILCDQHMPGQSGTELLDRFWSMQPEMRTRTILITGDTVDPDTQAYAERNGVRFHPKPFDLGALDQEVQSVLRENLATMRLLEAH